MRNIKLNDTKYKIPRPKRLGKWKNGVRILNDNGGVEFLHYAGVELEEPTPNFSFDAELSYLSYSKGRSSYIMILTDGINEFPVTALKLDELMKFALKDNKFIGRFTFFKQGQNYTLGLLREE